MSLFNLFNPTSGLEMEEVMHKLKENGYAPLLECLAEHESECYTKKGRLNKSATSRILGWKSKQLEDALIGMKDLLEKEFD